LIRDITVVKGAEAKLLHLQIRWQGGATETIDVNGEGLTSSTGKPFTVSIIRWIRFKHRIPGPPLPTGTLTVSQVRQRYGISLWVVHYWIKRGIVSAVQRKPNTPYAVTINNAVDRHLRKWIANSGHLHPSSQTQTV
jgi:hypothetical protein